MSQIGVYGAGAFGTALACALARHGAEVWLIGRDAQAVADMQARRENAKRLPGIALPQSLVPTSTLPDGIDTLLMVVPAQALRAALQDVPRNLALVLCAKGIERTTGLLQSQIAEGAGFENVSILSGPGFAAEIASGLPTALSLAAATPDKAAMLQADLSTPDLRLYSSDDMIGVQMGGALKNVYAIGCGLAVGAGLGESARAALMTRGFAEMVSLAVACGAEARTLTGLSGLGDLALTAGSRQSRNFAHGIALADQSTAAGKTVEGIATAQAVVKLAHDKGIEVPVARTVAAVLAGDLTLNSALGALMSRPLKAE